MTLSCLDRSSLSHRDELVMDNAFVDGSTLRGQKYVRFFLCSPIQLRLYSRPNFSSTPSKTLSGYVHSIFQTLSNGFGCVCWILLGVGVKIFRTPEMLEARAAAAPRKRQPDGRDPPSGLSRDPCTSHGGTRHTSGSMPWSIDQVLSRGSKLKPRRSPTFAARGA